MNLALTIKVLHLVLISSLHGADAKGLCEWGSLDPQYCECCLEEDFSHASCARCTAPAKGQGPMRQTAIVDKLAQFPKSTKAIRCRRWYLSGELPDDFPQRFPNLTVLNLAHNFLKGRLPASLWKLPHLKEVHLEGNNFEGALPASVGLAAELTHLGLADNNLRGPIPDEVGGLKRVQTISLLRNNFTSLPESVGSWSSVRCANFEQNSLTSLPKAIGGWSNLQVAHFQRNAIASSIPEEVGNWRLADEIRMDENRIVGQLPSSVGQWYQIREIRLGGNRLTGSIPDTVGSWRNIRSVDLANNGLTGPLPASVGNWQVVQRVLIQNNSLSGEVPESVGNWREMTQMDFGNNKFTGSVPGSINNWTLVWNLNLNDNAFTGIPPLTGLTRVDQLRLNNNQLASLPDLGMLTAVTELTVNDNALTRIGTLPPNVELLDISRNSLTEIPQAAYGLRSLSTFLLRNNSIRRWPPAGVLPGKVSGTDVICGIQPMEPRFNWPLLRRLDVSYNPLTVPIRDGRGGHIPTVRAFLSSLGYLQHLTDLACRSCMLSGPLQPEALPGLADDQPDTGFSNCSNVPPADKGFKSLQGLDLSGNFITAINVASPSSMLSADLSSNALTTLHPAWLNIDARFELFQLKIHQNPDLRIKVEPARGTCDLNGIAALRANPSDYTEQEGGFECTSLCPGLKTKYVMDSRVDEAALCRCAEGYGGKGRNCAACPADTYSYYNSSEDPNGLVRTCKPCPTGSTTQSKTGQKEISDCKCPVGTFLDGEGCTHCPQFPFRTTEARGEVQESACSCSSAYEGLKEFGGLCGCDDGSFMNHALRKCEPCNYAETCTWGTNISLSLRPPPVQAGFWVEPVSSGTFSRNTIWRCTSAGSCFAGGVCAEGRHGRACGLCQDKTHGNPNGPCVACSKSISVLAHGLLLTLGVFVVLAPAIIALHMGVSGRTKDLKVMRKIRALRASLKQMVKHLQLISVIGKFSVSWPAFAMDIFQAIESFTLSLPNFLALNCLKEQNTAASEMLTKWAQPVVFLATALLAMPLSWGLSKALRCLAKRCEGKRLARWLPNPTAVSMRPTDVCKVILFTVTLFWSTLAANSFEMLTCVQSPHGKMTVATYPHIECSFRNPEFMILASCSLVAVTLYLILPLLIMVRGYQKAATCIASSDRADRGWYSFLFIDFRDGHIIWLIVIMVKDATFAFIPAAFPGQGAAQLLITAAFSALHIVLVLQSLPFQNRTNSLLEAWNGATGAALCLYSTGMGFEKSTGMDELLQLFDGSTANPIYRGRAVGLVCVQIFSITVPAAVLFYQVLCLLQPTKELLPQAMQPISQQENEEWIKDFLEKSEGLASILMRMDEADLHLFRTLFERTSATMGHALSTKSTSPLVRMALKLSTESEELNAGSRKSSMADVEERAPEQKEEERDDEESATQASSSEAAGRPFTGNETEAEAAEEGTVTKKMLTI